eukprot:TRINITY_DN157_c0_g1_i7.p1 TRINITY_DN157_c0_g1~~TRINITY_DN157_c0_g1_i7.p1  ORF type:complete len:779 (+),score=269.21 TRINITY_DN157_c0_g1_i7:52-2337(+)
MAQQIIDGFMRDFEGSMRGSDLNGDGMIDRNELLNVLLRACTPLPTAQMFVDQVFAAVDKNRDGVISRADVQSQLPNMGPQIQARQEEVENLVREFQTNFQRCLEVMELQRDGMITRDELANALMRSGKPYQDALSMTNELFQRLDRDRNGVLTQTDVVQAIPAMPHHVVKTTNWEAVLFMNRFHEALWKCDYNKDRMLDVNELLNVFMRAGTAYQTANELVQSLLRRYDMNRDGRLSVAEVTQALPSMTGNVSKQVDEETQKVVNEIRTNFWSVMEQADVDRNGVLTRKELADLIQRRGVTYDVAEMVSFGVFGELDKDRNGVLSFQDLQQYVDPARVRVRRAEASVPTIRELGQMGYRNTCPPQFIGFVVLIVNTDEDCRESTQFWRVKSAPPSVWQDWLSGNTDDTTYSWASINGSYRGLGFLLKTTGQNTFNVPNLFECSVADVMMPTQQEQIDLFMTLLTVSLTDPNKSVKLGTEDIGFWWWDTNTYDGSFVYHILGRFGLTALTDKVGVPTLYNLQDRYPTFPSRVFKSIREYVFQANALYALAKTRVKNLPEVTMNGLPSDPVLSLCTSGLAYSCAGLFEVWMNEGNDAKETHGLNMIENGAMCIAAVYRQLSEVETPSTFLVDALGVVFDGVCALAIGLVAVENPAAAAFLACSYPVAKQGFNALLKLIPGDENSKRIRVGEMQDAFQSLTQIINAPEAVVDAIIANGTLGTLDATYKAKVLNVKGPTFSAVKRSACHTRFTNGMRYVLLSEV